MTTQEEQERIYLDGAKGAWLSVLQQALGHLAGRLAPFLPDDLKGDLACAVAERAEIVATLRRVCRHFGDNDWSDRLNLADVIEKHLERHLEARKA